MDLDDKTELELSRTEITKELCQCFAETERHREGRATVTTAADC